MEPLEPLEPPEPPATSESGPKRPPREQATRAGRTAPPVPDSGRPGPRTESRTGARPGLPRAVPQLNPVRARARFLEGEGVPEQAVRDPILSSWQRSRFWGVDADRIEAPYNAEFDPHSRLLTAARPVLDRLTETLAGTPMSLILTDSRGRVRDRRIGDQALSRHLDAICLAPGFSYAEEYVGTNGIGTAAEDGRAAHVFGSEHFSERLQRVSCAAAPIRNPVTGRVIGLVDLTSWQHTATPLMLALVREAATDIEERLLEIGSLRERAVLRAFLTGRPGSRKARVTIADGLLLADARATEMLGPADHRMLREVAERLGSGAAERLLLSDGRTVHARGETVASPTPGDRPAGYVIELHVVPEREAAPVPARHPERRLPGLAGSCPAWRTATTGLLRLCGERRWTLLAGERGTGKNAMVHAVHRNLRPTTPLASHDAAEARGRAAAWLSALYRDLSEDEGTVLLRHLDLLNPAELLRLDGMLRATASRSGWVVGLVTTDPHPSGPCPPALAGRFTAEITVPPLRHRPGDLPVLAAHLLAQHTHDPEVRCSEAALRALERAPWPGNVRQLEGSLRYAATHRAGPVIEETDLPPGLLSSTRRSLTPWEVTERDMIIQALLNSGGDKATAAKSLGISRATIYRKITAYGIRPA
ncbi:GAF domain-containing protein [Streptomyces sp. NPDC007084]|uniref:sigma-54-dependent Fis family transcriptional regulator n=1 Tax=Streptomyces sp. NPDC007084 TaxID=3154313 RepID=UPI00345124BF